MIYSIKQIRDLIEKHSSDILLSEDYKNNISKLEIQCHKCDDVYSTSLSSFKNGRCCLYCFGNRFNLDKAIKLIASGGDMLVSTKFVNCSEKMDILCSGCNQVYKMSIYKFKTGNRCRGCGNKKTAQKKLKYTINDVRKYIKEQDEELISTRI